MTSEDVTPHKEDEDFKLRVLIVFGTRPEAIKLAPIIQEIKRRSQTTCLQAVVCVTAQHRFMLDQVLQLFNISADYDLNIMEENQTPTQVASTVLSKIESVLKKEQVDWVIVQGDTTTAAAASLATFYAHKKVAHVEAGLRTYDKWRPFPEEINRRVAGVIADLHFAPTQRARQNLLREGISDDKILVTGNPVIDALKFVVAQPETKEIEDLLKQLNLNDNANETRLILVTAHRRENFGQPIKNICLALKDIAESSNGKVRIIYPVHLNPNINEPVRRILGNVSNIVLTQPMNYFTLVHILKRSYLILTDSGGIQEEAPSLGIPVLVLRDVTERPEAVEAGTVRIVGTDREKIVKESLILLEDSEEYERMAYAVNPYGDGYAAQRIVGSILGEKIEPFMSRY